MDVRVNFHSKLTAITAVYKSYPEGCCVQKLLFRVTFNEKLDSNCNVFLACVIKILHKTLHYPFLCLEI